MVRRGSTVRVRQRACKIPAHGDFSFRTTCSLSHVRWVWSRLWSFRVRDGSDLSPAEATWPFGSLMAPRLSSIAACLRVDLFRAKEEVANGQRQRIIG